MSEPLYVDNSTLAALAKCETYAVMRYAMDSAPTRSSTARVRRYNMPRVS